MRVLTIGLLGGLLLAAGCSKSPEAEVELPPDQGGSKDGSGGGGGRADGGGGPSRRDGGGGGNNEPEIIDAPAGEGCGNAELDRMVEACDDGNREGGDGCSANCAEIEEGYSCNPPGQPCHQVARCGDSIVATSELCDDGNLADADGCSARCKLEIGFRCEGAPSKCTPTTCGDGNAEGTEACDDGNDIPFDGCSATCQAEPNCDKGACTSKCGDGLILDEGCDDGNNKDGDGCSSKCTKEEGFTCTTNTDTELLGELPILRVPAIFRDFKADHPDFEEPNCKPPSVVKGIVKDTLANGKPDPVATFPANSCISSPASFKEWYVSGPKNSTIVGEIVLFENGAGGFVNRFGPNGEKYVGDPLLTNFSTLDHDPITMQPAPRDPVTMCACNPGRCLPSCPPPMGTGGPCCADAMERIYDGNPLFFPIDDSAQAFDDMRLAARIPDEYGHKPLGWPTEISRFPNAKPHNFSFTTEVVHWFEYKDTTSASLQFSGDDDVWVFINGKLALDLGGVHVPSDGAVNIDATTAPMFGLEPGSVYPIQVFHAERKSEGSSFRLTLSGFSVQRSDCEPICGDGIVTLGEECDDGKNDGGYDECDPGCKLGPRCGDGELQTPEEECDDGNRKDGDMCGSACRNLVFI